MNPIAMTEAYLCDGIRTPFGRYGGVLASVRTDDLAGIPLKALMARNANVDWSQLDDVILGCANQSGEDNRNVARMALLLAGLPVGVPGLTVNRLCGSSLEALALAARAIKAGEAELVIAGGVESMSRAPYVMGKAQSAFARDATLYDTTLGWRFVNPLMEKQYGVDTMSVTAENVAEDFAIGRSDQDAYAWRSQQRAHRAQTAGILAAEITPVSIAQKKGEELAITLDEHPRADTQLDKLARLPGIVRADGSVTAGNSSGINDGAAALLVASEAAVKRYKLTPLARVVGTAVAGVEPRIMGFGPAPASQKLLGALKLGMADMHVVELNEAFAAQVLAVTRALGLADDADHVNPNGGAIALGHPLGASGARLALAAVNELQRRKGRYALCAMCIGVGQGIATVLERV
jgi:acetyl-CoA acyltransferase